MRNLFSEAASGEQGAHASSYTPHLDDEGVATSLLDHWATNAELALPTSDEIGGSTDLWDLETIRRAFSVDASRALDRACMNSFLSWIRTSLRNSTAKAGEGSEAAKEAASTLAHLDLLCDAADLTLPAYQYPLARTLTRQIHLHVGPTNSGKTHGALLALCKARTGVYAGPLRLLAHEVWERINEGTVSPGVAARACNLITGEEQRIVDPYCGLYSCTVEMANVERPVEVAVVDEIQMIGDSQRGYAWTGAVLGLPAKEVHLCGEASVIPLLERMADACGDVLHIHEYKRLTPLSIAEESLGSDLGKVRKGDCVVTFSRSNIFALKREIEQKTGLRCAVAYGGLPPETKSEQARLFNNPDSGFDVMVASDAIGMGLNL